MVCLLSGRGMTPITGISSIAAAAISPNGGTIYWGSKIYRIRGSKAVADNSPVTPKMPTVNPDLPPIQIPLIQVSGDGKTDAYGTKLYTSNLKTEIPNEPETPTVLDRTKGRLVRMERDKSLTVWSIGQKKPSHKVRLDFIPLPGGDRDRITALYLTGTPNAIILTTNTGVVILDLP